MRDEANCAQCVFWIRHPCYGHSDNGEGECRRFPPNFEHPMTMQDHWCGEFKLEAAK